MKKNMKRTQIYLPEDLKSELGVVADSQGMSMGELMRNILSDSLIQYSTKNHDESNADKVFELASWRVKGGPKDLSARMDDYLYGEESTS